MDFMDEAFAEYLRTSHHEDVDLTVSQHLSDSLLTVESALKKVSADPLIDPRQRVDLESRSLSLEDVKNTNARLHKELEGLLEGKTTNPTQLVADLSTHSANVYEMAASMAEDTSSQAAREAEKAASELMKSVSALAHLQRAYEAGFERAKTIAVNTKRSGSREASDATAYTR